MYGQIARLRDESKDESYQQKIHSRPCSMQRNTLEALGLCERQRSAYAGGVTEDVTWLLVPKEVGAADRKI